MSWEWLFWGLLVAGLILLALLAVRVIAGGFRREEPSDSGRGGPNALAAAYEILDERYARGELNSEEYQGRLRALKDRSTWSP